MLLDQVRKQIRATAEREDHFPGLQLPPELLESVSRRYGSLFVLQVIPLEEFLTAIELAVAATGPPRRSAVRGRATNGPGSDAVEWLVYVDRALSKTGSPYRLDQTGFAFAWAGDPEVQALTTRPALEAFEHPRLVGARAEFAAALTHRRHGDPKSLEDAIDEAAKAVESALKAVLDSRGVARPSRQSVDALWLAAVGTHILPVYLHHLVTAAAGPRNHMASHGQGTEIREVSAQLADATLGAAATAITLLAHYLD